MATGIYIGAKKALPSNYTQVEYIESRYDHYIDTGFKPNQNTRVVMDVWSDSGDNTAYFGTRSSSSSSDMFMLYEVSLTSLRSDFGSGQNTFTVDSSHSRGIVDMSKTTTSFKTYSVSNSSSTFTSSYNLYLLAVNTAGTASLSGKVKLYSCQIYDNGTLVRDYIPCINASGTTGVYDLVGGKFYSNAGSGEFTVGRTVPSTSYDAEVAKSVSKLYVGVGNIARKVTKAYIGDNSGIARLCYQAKAPWNPVIVVAGYNTNGSAAKRVYTSTDCGKTWTQCSIPTNSWGVPSNICYGNGVFVFGTSAYNDGNNYYHHTSNDGLTWKSYHSDRKIFTNIVFGNGKFVAIAYDYYNGYSYIGTSTDGATWSWANKDLVTARNGVHLFFDNANNKFFAWSQTYAEAGYISTDGVTWTKTSSNGNSSGFNVVSMANGKFFQYYYNDSSYYRYTEDYGTTIKSTSFPTDSEIWYKDGYYHTVGGKSTNPTGSYTNKTVTNKPSQYSKIHQHEDIILAMYYGGHNGTENWDKISTDGGATYTAINPMGSNSYCYISGACLNVDGGGKYTVGERGGSTATISFTIDGTTYQAKEGMTWLQWVYSDYNTRGLVVVALSGKSCVGIYDADFGGYFYLCLGDSVVLSSETITSGTAYYIE